MNELVKLFLQGCEFNGLSRNGLVYTATEKQIWSMPGFPDQQAFLEGDCFELEITVTEETIKLDAQFRGKVLGSVIGLHHEVTLEFIYNWCENANWSIE